MPSSDEPATHTANFHGESRRHDRGSNRSDPDAVLGREGSRDRSPTQATYFDNRQGSVPTWDRHRDRNARPPGAW
jgi:hypothetical protein